MLECLEWRSVQASLKFSTLTFVFKILNGLLPQYLYNYITFNNEIHNYSTRNSDNIHIRKTNFKKSMNCLFFKCFNEYNSLPTEIKHCISLPMFKQRLSVFLSQ